MPAVWRRNTGRGVELRLLSDKRLLGEPALRGSRRNTTRTGTIRESAHARLLGAGARGRHGRARRARWAGRAQGAPDRSARNAPAGIRRRATASGPSRHTELKLELAWNTPP